MWFEINSNLSNGQRAHFYTPFGVVRWVRYLALPLGELAERSEDGEGKIWPYQKTIANWKTPGGFAGR